MHRGATGEQRSWDLSGTRRRLAAAAACAAALALPLAPPVGALGRGQLQTVLGPAQPPRPVQGLLAARVVRAEDEEQGLADVLGGP
ncbi:hypothetical protein ABZ465_09310 [Streptomyces griseoincarnatus]